MKFKTTFILLAIISANAASSDGIPLRASENLNRKVIPKASQVGARTNSNSNSNSTSTATSNSSGGMGVGSQGQSLTIDSHAVYQAQERNPVATAVAPAIISSNDTCMGSTSIAGAAASFGFSAGTTWTDENCVMLKNSREMWNMGFKGSALARMCMDPLNKEAFEATGINCPARRDKATAERSTRAGNATASSGQFDDNYRY